MYIYELVLINKKNSLYNIKKNVLLIKKFIIYNFILISFENWGYNKFSYKFHKENIGYYIYFTFFISDKSKIKNFFIFLNKNTNIIRFLFLKIFKKEISYICLKKIKHFKKKIIKKKGYKNGKKKIFLQKKV